MWIGFLHEVEKTVNKCNVILLSEINFAKKLPSRAFNYHKMRE